MVQMGVENTHFSKLLNTIYNKEIKVKYKNFKLGKRKSYTL